MNKRVLLWEAEKNRFEKKFITIKQYQLHSKLKNDKKDETIEKERANKSQRNDKKKQNDWVKESK